MPPTLKKGAMIAYRARQCITLAGESLSRGAALSRPLPVLDNAVVLTQGGIVHRVESFASFRPPAGTRIRDVGEVCLMPALVNAHTHLQLSFLGADGPKTLWHQGFVPWLRSLIPLLTTPLTPEPIARAVQALCDSGTVCAGDFTGHGLPLVQQALHHSGMDSVHFCEWFGFDLPPAVEDEFQPFPPAVAAQLEHCPALAASTLAPAGHALYSTHSQLLQQAQRYCCQHGVPFSLHLAESPEEDEAMLTGTGPLVDVYAERILPAGWQAPAVRPVQAAAQWGLLGPNTLAVHGVQCTPEDARLLADSGTALCLCPRSNAILAVGEAPVPLFIKSGIALCMGTDGLSSVPTLDIWEDARCLHGQQHISMAAIIRMLTVNGAYCLQKKYLGSLEAGKRAAFTVLPADVLASIVYESAHK